MAIDHTNCTHPRTAAGRRACRASKTSPTEQAVREEVNGITPAPVRRARLTGLQTKLERMANDNHRENGWIAGLRAVKHAAKPDRIQPRRSGARVAAPSSTCVQAALHVDAHGGRCACGWVAQKVA